MLCAVLVLGTCDDTSDISLSSKLELQIRQDFAYLTGRNVCQVQVRNYYGTFNSISIVIMCYGAERMALWNETVAGIQFDTPNWTPIQAWTKGAFYTLTQAYNNNWLDLNSMQIIASRHETYFAI